MKREVKDWTVKKIYEKRNQIIFPDYQREPKIWRLKDKQLLIDSILRDIDIPKLYFHIDKDNEVYEVVDGQQRLWAVWQFIDNEYRCEIRGRNKFYKELDIIIKDKILSYKLQIAQITDASEEYLRELFLRLQLGLLLITGEKLHASAGLMKNFVFLKMVRHPFIKAISIPPRRYSKETLCAQICINSFSRSKNNIFYRTRYEDLKYFFEIYANPEGVELKFFEERCKHIMTVLDHLNNNFKDKASQLRNRSFILSLYLFAEELVETREKSEINDIMPIFVRFSLECLSRMRAEAKAGFKRRNEELYIFESYLNNAPGERYQIEKRHEKIREYFEYFRDKEKIKGDK